MKNTKSMAPIKTPIAPRTLLPRYGRKSRRGINVSPLATIADSVVIQEVTHARPGRTGNDACDTVGRHGHQLRNIQPDIGVVVVHPLSDVAKCLDYGCAV